MKVVKCASCAAPFSEVPEDTAVRCAFCRDSLPRVRARDGRTWPYR